MMVDATILNSIRFVVGVGILSYASYTDIKTRRASNLLWVVMGSIGVVLLLIQYLTNQIHNMYYLLFIPVMIGLMYLLFQLRLIFGGADAKAIMALAILVPIEPTIGSFPLWYSIMPYSWVIFANAVILFLLVPISLLIFNIRKRHLEFPHCALGYKMSIEKAKQNFIWPLEKIVEGKRKFSYLPTDFDVDDELLAFENAGIQEIWVTPKVPFMVPLLVGFIVAFFLGDIMTHILHSFM